MRNRQLATPKISIDAEFKRLIPPLTDEEYNQLEANLKAHGCREPLTLWGSRLIDGHNRYDICTRLKIPFQTTTVQIESREAAKLWIEENQMGRRNLTNDQRAAIAYRIIVRLTAISKNQRARKAGLRLVAHASSKPQQRVREEIAKKKGVSTRQVRAVHEVGKNDSILVDRIADGKVSIRQAKKNLKPLPVAHPVPLVTIKPNTLHHGDCLQVMPGIPDASVDLIIADLPYKQVNTEWDQELIPFEPLWEQFKRVLKPNGVVVLSASGRFTFQVYNSNPAWFRYEMIWYKDNATQHNLAKKRPLLNHETILVFSPAPLGSHTFNPHPGGDDDAKLVVKRGTKSNLYRMERNYYTTAENGPPYPLTVIEARQDLEGEQLHDTSKPTALWLYLVMLYSDPRSVVLDPCMGSGPTIQACITGGRKYIGIEQNPQYYAGCLRLEKFVTEIMNSPDSEPIKANLKWKKSTK